MSESLPVVFLLRCTLTSQSSNNGGFNGGVPAPYKPALRSVFPPPFFPPAMSDPDIKKDDDDDDDYHSRSTSPTPGATTQTGAVAAHLDPTVLQEVDAHAGVLKVEAAERVYGRRSKWVLFIS